MDDFVLMEVFEGSHDLREIVLGLHLCQSFPPFYEFVESVVGAYFQEDVHILVVFEDMFEFYNVRVV